MRHHAYALKAPKHPNRPYVLDLQSNLLADLSTRLVAPLQKLSSTPHREIIDDLMPIVTIDNEEYVLVAQEAAAVPSKALGKDIADLTHRSTDFTNALDRLVG